MFDLERPLTSIQSLQGPARPPCIEDLESGLLLGMEHHGLKPRHKKQVFHTKAFGRHTNRSTSTADHSPDARTSCSTGSGYKDRLAGGAPSSVSQQVESRLGRRRTRRSVRRLQHIGVSIFFGQRRGVLYSYSFSLLFRLTLGVTNESETDAYNPSTSGGTSAYDASPLPKSLVM